ncbi:hypothetical protein ES319_D13G013800v1 [Gossypium barbadense]|uniref:non-specific serine/threonine protein kinase n=1 Tax=Gossypium barbadense TaxID=3634 RepID=A0A5J5NKL1_GOSBA|nr:hypothetical protein ES319_D13G013800v1 [Gossypium barbadense]KAB1993212.1 hypothetical protein ES319_D13G013800v1 [Gossypium barbadense]
MNQIHFFNLTSTFFPVLYLVFFTFFFQARKVTAVDENFRICTVPRYCGKMNIKFPFFIQGRDDPRCGYPGFEIHCRNNSLPSISFGDGDYIINDIYYHNQSCHLSRAVSFDKYAICSHSIRNISLLSDWFFLPSLQNKTFLFSNCNLSSSHELSRYNIHCAAKNESNATLALFSNDPMLNFASEYCDTRVVVPVAFTSGEGSLEGMLNRGFMVEWITSNCSICEASGGKCGFDNATRHFKCFCRDRPHAWHCTPKNKNELRFKLGLGLASSIVGIVLVILAFYYFIRKFSSDNIDENIEAFLKDHECLAPRRYRYSDIKKVTNSFQDKLGKGGYGDVYKGKLLDGRHVAVKILNNSQSNGEEFINEVASISRTSHVNIVTLLGFCFERSCKALIYEFMPNGSLEKFIFQERKDRLLKWDKLYQIAVGIARGLEYLHRGCSTRILHFDIKPHNILLDDEFVPKISDFGLAKLCLEKESAISMTGARGTAGYIAPEVFSRNFGRVSHKSDVYSYGMMVLEMVGGRKNISVEVDRTSEIYFPYWIYNRIELDEELGLEDIESEDDQERARKMIIVSLWCIQIDPSNRPTMSRVVEMLEGFTNSLTIPPKPFLSSPPRS